MTDWRSLQISKAERDGRRFIADGVGYDKFRQGAAQGTYPEGSTWLWASDCVYGPVQTKKQA